MSEINISFFIVCCANIFCQNIIKFSARNVFIEKFLDAISVGRHHEIKQQMYFQISVFCTKNKILLMELKLPCKFHFNQIKSKKKIENGKNNK